MPGWLRHGPAAPRSPPTRVLPTGACRRRNRAPRACRSATVSVQDATVEDGHRACPLPRVDPGVSGVVWQQAPPLLATCKRLVERHVRGGAACDAGPERPGARHVRCASQQGEVGQQAGAAEDSGTIGASSGTRDTGGPAVPEAATFHHRPHPHRPAPLPCPPSSLLMRHWCPASTACTSGFRSEHTTGDKCWELCCNLCCGRRAGT